MRQICGEEGRKGVFMEGTGEEARPSRREKKDTGRKDAAGE